MTHVLRIAHLRIALHVANPEVGKREGILVGWWIGMAKMKYLILDFVYFVKQ